MNWGIPERAWRKWLEAHPDYNERTLTEVEN